MLIPSLWGALAAPIATTKICHWVFKYVLFQLYCKIAAFFEIFVIEFQDGCHARS